MFTASGFKPTIVVCVNDILAADRKCGSHCQTEDMARGCWPVGKSTRAANCEWLVAVENRTIVGAWEIDRSKGWKRPDKKFFNLRPPSFDPVNILLKDGLRHLRYVCEVKHPVDGQVAVKFPSKLPLGFRLYGQIGYINA